MKTCQIYIGRLVSHPCGRKTSLHCAACRRAVCNRHIDPGGVRCAQCAGRYAPPPAPIRVTEEEMFAFSPEEISTFDAPYGPPANVSQVDDS
jgi:hypothetical protein